MTSQELVTWIYSYLGSSFNAGYTRAACRITNTLCCAGAQLLTAGPVKSTGVTRVCTYKLGSEMGDSREVETMYV